MCQQNRYSLQMVNRIVMEEKYSTLQSEFQIIIEQYKSSFTDSSLDLSFDYIIVKNEESLSAINKLCSNNFLMAIISITDSSTNVNVYNYFKSSNILYHHIAIDTVKSHIDTGGMIIHKLFSESLLRICVSIMKSTAMTQSIVFHQNDRISNEVIRRLANMKFEEGITMRSVSIFSRSNILDNIDKLVELLQAWEIRMIFLIHDNSYKVTKFLIDIKEKSDLLESNYYWMILSPFISPESLIQAVPHSSNVAIIQSYNDRCRLNDSSHVTCNIQNQTIINYQLEMSLQVISEGLKIKNISNPIPGDLKFICENTAREIFTLEQHQLIKQNYEKILEQQNFQVQATLTNLPGNSTKFVTTAEYDNKEHLSKTFFSRMFPNKFESFKNTTLVICSVPFEPFMIFKTPGKTKRLHEIDGFLYDIISYLAKELEFEPIIYNPDDGEFGAPVEGSLYFSGCIGDLQKGLADLGGSVFTRSYVRSQVVDYLVPLIEDSTGVVLPITETETSMWNIFRPLSVDTWLAIVIGIAVATLACYLTAKFSPFSAWNLRLKFAIVDEVTMKEHVWNIIGSFLQQGQDFYPYCISSRSILAVWWLFTVIIFAAYTADLTSYLTVALGINRISTLEELSLQNKIKLNADSGTYVDQLISTSSITVYQRLNNLRTTRTFKNYCVDDVLEFGYKDVACIDDFSYLSYYASTHCSRLYTLPEKLGATQSGFVARKDAKFRDVMNYQLLKLTESGLMTKWFNNRYKNPFLEKDNCDGNNDNMGKSVNSHDVLGVYVFCAGFYVVGGIFLMFELIWVKILKKSVADIPF